MDEGWHVAGMILTVQVAEKRKLAAHTTGQPPASRTAVLNSRATQALMAIAIPSGRVRFATFEVDLRSGELHKQGIKIKLHDQPFQVLAMLLEHPGELVTREQLHQRLWPSDTFVDFDVGLNSAIKRLRDALGDSAEKPRYIETLPRRGYRFIARIENGDLPASPVVEVHLGPILPLQLAPKLWNKRRFVVTAGVAALLIVAALASWRLFFARPVLTETDVILLASFVNKTGDPIFDNSLDKALEVKLTESPFLSLFPEPGVREMMRMMRHDPNERVTRELGIEICNRQGLKAVVVPEIAAFGSRYLITLEAIEARSQKSIARRQEEAENKDQVIAALGKAGSQLRRRLGESLSSLEKYDAPLDFATTSSLEALQAYRTGLMQFRSGRLREAIALLERAVELDPQFCSAHRMLANVYVSLGDGQAARQNYAKCFELKDRRLTQEENFRAAATNHMNMTGNLEKALAALVLYKQAYPRSTVASNLLGLVYLRMGRTEEALREFQRAIDLAVVPAAPDQSNASQALMILGRFEEAKKILDQWWQKGPLSSFQMQQRYRIAFFENDAATMERLAREAPADDMRWLGLQQQLAFFRGDLGKLRSLSETLVNQQRRAQRMENAADELAWHARLESYLGNYALARKLCRQAVEAGKDSNLALGHCAKALAEAGDVRQAEAVAAKLDRLHPEDTVNQRLDLPLIRSTIERQRGNAAKAVDLLAPVAQYEQGESQILYHRAQAYLAAGEHAKAAAEFEKLIGHRGWLDWGVFSPLAQLGLARAYAMQGDHENSRKAYDDFFFTWKDADPNIPTLRQAKAEYTKLTATSSIAASASANEQ
jgi:DNA-binding winged helix-turn-helix (wHTH) protein/tetratricopeptide (TPR) repeat protein